VVGYDLVSGAPRVVTAEPFSARGAIVVVDGELDLDTAPQLEAVITDQIANHHRHLVIDLSATAFLDSVALRTLLVSICPLQDDPASAVVLVGARGAVRRLIAVNGIDHMFSLFDTRQAAVDHLQDSLLVLDAWRQVSRRRAPGASPPGGRRPAARTTFP